jgi:hypothetical protein
MHTGDENCNKILVRKFEERRHFWDLDIANRIILKRGLKNYEAKILFNLSGSKQEPVSDFCEHGNETSAYTKDGKITEQLNQYQLLKRDSAPVSENAEYFFDIRQNHSNYCNIHICFLLNLNKKLFRHLNPNLMTYLLLCFHSQNLKLSC